MLFEKKIKRVVDIKQIEEEANADSPEPLEKGDRLAIFLSALIVFGPVLLILGLILFLIW